MKKYKRICLIGNSGAGKSTLARKLGEIYNIPIYHLDKVYWLPNWQKAPRDLARAEVSRIATLSEWIIDGNNKSTFAQRFEKADLVIFMDLPPLFCLYRAIKRSLTTTVRLDMAEGCHERFDWSFYLYILRFRKQMYSHIFAALEKYQDNFDFHHFKKQRQVDEFILNLQK